MKKIFGLIGYPLSHSFSPQYFEKKFQTEKITDAEYKLFPLENINDFPQLLKKNSALCGLNVTIPHKEKIIPFLDELDETARKVKAVNCIKILKMPNGKRKTKGFNTDVFGFENSLKKYLKPHHKNALILGTGGASKAVAYVLKKLKINFFFVSRTIETKRKSRSSETINYKKIDLHILQTHLLIINTTPLGMHFNNKYSIFNIQHPPIPYQFLTSQHLLFDLIYNPPETLFLKYGKEKGATVVNGLEMLKLQAEKSWQIWNS